MPRKYVITLLSGLAMFTVVYLVDALLARAGLHAEQTYIDNALVGAITASLVFFLQQQHERELSRQRQCAKAIEQMNHHIRNALQVIVYSTNVDLRDQQELEHIRDAVDRIDWALREILPTVRASNPVETDSSQQPSFPLERGSHTERPRDNIVL